MPDIADTLWSEVDDRNSDVAPNGFPPGMPAYIDQIGRMMMGAIKRSWARQNPVYETTGTDDAYIVSPASAPNAINIYEIIQARIDRANTTTTPTFQYGMTNPRTIMKVDATGKIALAVGDLVAGNAHGFWYDGTDWILINPGTIEISEVPGLQAALDAKLAKASNLSDVADPAAALSNIGGVSGPASSTDGNFAVMSGTSGKIIADSGKNAASFATAAQGALAASALQAADRPQFESVASASSFSPTDAPSYIQTTGYAMAADGGAALYKKVSAEPSHAGKFSITLADGTTVIWYELAEIAPRLESFGDPTLAATFVAADTYGKPFRVGSGAGPGATTTISSPVEFEGADFPDTLVTPISAGIFKKRYRIYSFRATDEYSDTPSGYRYLNDLSGLDIYYNDGGNGYSDGASNKTSMPAIYIERFSSGAGDKPGITVQSGITRDPNWASATSWLDYNSNPLYDGQAGASSGNVNLYGAEYHQDDQGHADTTAHGMVISQTRNADDTLGSGGFQHPWVGYIAQSLGSIPADVAYQAMGPYNFGLDLTATTFDVRKAGIVMESDTRIYMGADHTAGSEVEGWAGENGKSLGGSYVLYSKEVTELQFVVAGGQQFAIGNGYTLTRGAIYSFPGANVGVFNPGEVTFDFPNNTTLRFKAMGSDGTVRSASLTLA